MTILLRTILLTAGVVFLTSQTRAENPKVPPDSAAFVSYCDSHLEDCREAVVDVNNMELLKNIHIVGNNQSTKTFAHVRVCTLPKAGATTLAERKALHREQTITIVNWLKTHNAERRPKTGDAILQAMAALWPKECK